MSELPETWEQITLGDILDRFQYGFTAKADASAEGLRFLRITDIEDGVVKWKQVPGLAEEIEGDKYILHDGDFVFARSGSVEKACRIENPPDAIFASYLIRGTPVIPDLSDWLAWFIKSNLYLQQIFAKAVGIGLSNVNAKKLATIEVPIAPLAEQQRIVAKLDALFARTRQARAELESIPKLIEHYKQAILAAAYDWAVQAVTQTSTLGDIVTDIRNGVGKPPENTPPGVPILKISAIRPMTVRMDERRYYLLDEGEDISRYILKSGDLLFTRYNGNPDFVASCGMIRELDEVLIYPDKLIRVRLDMENVDPSFVEAIASSPQARAALSPYIKSAAGQHGISGKDLKQLRLPIPNLSVQHEIVDFVTLALSRVNQTQDETLSASHLIDHLEQAILTKAFRGELVPQDPSDEPAAVLLERIRAARVEQSSGGRVKKRK